MKKLLLALGVGVLLAAGGPQVGAKVVEAVTGTSAKINEAEARHRHRHCRRYRAGRQRVCRRVNRTRCFWRYGRRVCRRVYVGRRCYWRGNRWRTRCFWHRHRHTRRWHGHR